MKASEVIANLQRRFPNEPEYIKAVSQVLGTLEEEYNKHPEFEKAKKTRKLPKNMTSRKQRTWSWL